MQMILSREVCVIALATSHREGVAICSVGTINYRCAWHETRSSMRTSNASIFACV